MNNKFKFSILLGGAAMLMLTSCNDEWLKTKALSFYTPDNVYVDADGFYASITTCERNARHEYFGDAAPIVTQFVQSDMCVEGTTDKAGPSMDMDTALLPDANLNSTDRTKVGWYWYEGYKGIKYANVVISRIDNIKWESEAERNAVLGAAYFQRAYRYFKLTHEFGDVPYIYEEIKEPKLDFYTYDRWSILETEYENVEFAYKWVPEVVDRGRTSKAGCGVLLMKYCMALGKWDRAIEVGKEIVANHPLMTERFTSTKDKHPNLMFDLHSREAKFDMTNTEGLYYVVSVQNVDGSERIQTMRNCVPYWNSASACKTPDNQTGTAVDVDAADVDTDIDNNHTYGRGIGRLRPIMYFTSTIWTDKEKNDMRGIYNHDSWKSTFDFKYNHPNLKKNGNPWYGKNLVKSNALSAEDSIRAWFSWPHFKVFVPDELSSNGQWAGGETPWYVYRSAEVYIMMAECYYWKGASFNQQAADMLNVVRTRAGADPLSAGDIGIAAILNERARELYYEENRHDEIARIAYTYAKTGKACEEFGGRTYSLDNISGEGGTNSNIKKEGVNFFWDWINKYNNYYNKGISHKWATYRMSVHHILWPIPAESITSNSKGHINQNVGYPGAENNIEPLVYKKGE